MQFPENFIDVVFDKSFAAIYALCQKGARLPLKAGMRVFNETKTQCKCVLRSLVSEASGQREIVCGRTE